MDVPNAEEIPPERDESLDNNREGFPSMSFDGPPPFKGGPPFDGQPNMMFEGPPMFNDGLPRNLHDGPPRGT